MFNNPYEAPQELATGGHVTKELNSVTVHFDDIHYALSSGQLNGGYHHTLAVRNQQLTYQIETEKDLPGGSVANYLAQEFEQIDTPVHFSASPSYVCYNEPSRIRQGRGTRYDCGGHRYCRL